MNSVNNETSWAIKILLKDAFSKTHLAKNLSDAVPIHNGLKQRHALSSIILNFSSVYTIQNAQEDKGGLELKENRQLLVHAVYVNLLREHIVIMKKNTEALLYSSKEDGREN